MNENKSSILNIFFVIIVLIASVVTFFFFDFNADDAYIYMRYAVNLAESGSLVYNLGERINTLTSPLTALVDVVLYVLFQNIAFSHKLLSLLLLSLSLIMILNQFKESKQSQLIILSIALLSPCVLLWTVGGLDTLFILFFATILTVITYKLSKAGTEINFHNLMSICILAGILFFTRFSTVLFTAPIVLYAFLKSKSVKESIVGALIGSIIPLSWLIFSYCYYGDIFPTSFYVKEPGYSTKKIMENAYYIIQYFIFINFFTFLLLFIFSVWSRRKLFSIFANQFRKLWWLYLGIFFMLAYGLSVAGTTHMMFSFRFFVPYIPALTIIIADLFYIQKEEGSDDIKINKSNKWFVTSLMITIIFQAIQAGYTYQYSVNGIALNGELRKYSIKENNNFMKIAKDFSFVIKNHWNSLPVSKSRQPRIYTFGEGILPYTYMEAYFSGVLISHRHNCSLMLDRPMVDYMLLYKPGFSDKDKTDENTQIIKVVPFAFNGADGSVVLYFNENPCENYLPEKINDPCKQYAP